MDVRAEVGAERGAARGKPALPRWLLLAGLLAGAGIAASGLVTHTNKVLPAQAVARVNNRLILRDAWLRAVAAVAGERRGELSAADQRHILDRLIDEELLVQHGVALGLVEQDARLRSTMVSEVMQQATGAAAKEPDDASLRSFYADNAAFFAPAARVRVKAWRLAADGARTEFQPGVPDAMLPLAKVQAYLGPALTAAAAQLAVNSASEPIVTDSGRVVLQLLEKEAGAALPYEQVRDEVRAEYKRRADEAAVRALLAELRASGNIAVDRALP